MWDDAAALGLMAVTAFLAATVLPAQSELVFVGLLATSKVDSVTLFAVASLANTAGSFTNWWLGRVLKNVSVAEQANLVADAPSRLDRLPPWLRSLVNRMRPSPEALAAGEARFRRWGWVALVFAWAPVVGDVATLAAGALNYPAGRFLLLVGLGKAARYAALWAGYGAVA
jgi:membrane protein YqaA with SNARE-associated domain